MQNKSRHTKWLAALSTAVVVIAVFVLFVVMGHGKPVQYKQLNSKIGSYSIREDTLYTLDKNGFVATSLETGTEKRYSLIRMSSTVPAFSWDGSGALFLSSPDFNTIDDVAIAANEQGVDSMRPHWWRYDAKTNALTVFNPRQTDDCTSLTEISSDSFVCVKQASDTVSSDLYLVKSSGAGAQYLFTNPYSIRSVYYDSVHGSLYYVTQRLSGFDSVYSYSFKNNEESLVYKSSGGIDGLSVDKDGLVYLLQKRSPQKQTSGQGSPSIGTVAPDDKHYDGQALVVYDAHTTKTLPLRNLPVRLYTDSGVSHISYSDGEILAIQDSKPKRIFEADRGTKKSPAVFYFSHGDKRYYIDKGSLYVQSSK